MKQELIREQPALNDVLPVTDHEKIYRVYLSVLPNTSTTISNRCRRLNLTYEKGDLQTSRLKLSHVLADLHVNKKDGDDEDGEPASKRSRKNGK